MSTLLQQKSLIEKFLNESPAHLSAHSFVNIYSWKDFFEFEIKLINQNLCVFAKNDLGCFLFLPPLGREILASTTQECFKIMRQINGGTGIARIENVSERQLGYFPDAQYDFYKKGYEYCYYRKDLAALQGNAFKSKRGLLNYFMKNYEGKLLPFESDMAEICLRLYDHWALERQLKHREDVYVQMLNENRLVHQLVLKHYRELGLIGRVVVESENPVAYTFGYPINEAIFCIFLEVADLKFKGLSTFVFNQFCADAELARFKFINVMDDFELDNIAQTKLSFRPVMLCPSYIVTEKESR